jgi:hypothetical protein
MMTVQRMAPKMKGISAILLIVALVVLVACAPAAQERSTSAPAGEQPELTVAPPLATVPAQPEASPTGEMAPVQALPPNMDAPTVVVPAGSGEAAESGAPESGVVPPSGTVDVGQLTPASRPDDGGPLIVQPEPGVPDAQAKIVGLAIEDAAARLGVDVSQVRLLAVEEKQWPDTGLGCPSIGTVQAQVITPGFLITLEADGNFLTYHTDLAKRLLLCLDAIPDSSQ